MLIRAWVLSLALVLAAPMQAAFADGSWVEGWKGDNNASADVTVGAATGGRPGGGGSGSTASGGGCPDAPAGRCSDVAGGWWSSQHRCYLLQVQVPPELAAEHPAETPYRCSSNGQLVDGTIDLRSIFWLTGGPGAGPDPAVLAQQAVQTMQLKAVAVGLTPPPGSANPTLVGMPVWMWVDRPDVTTFGPAAATASAGAVTVPATAKVSTVTWDTGDGTRATCGAGTPYAPAYQADPSPTCGHRYTSAGTYPVTATSNWVVDWAGGGQAGRLTLALTARSSVAVADAYGLVQEQR